VTSARSDGVAQNTLWTMANFAVHVLFVNTVIMLLARYFGPTEFGTYKIAMSLIVIGYAFVSLGLNDVIVGRLVRAKGAEADTVLMTGIGLQFVGAAFVALCLIGATYLIYANNTLLHEIMWVLSILLWAKALDSLRYWFEVERKSRAMFLPALVVLTVGFGVKLFLYIEQMSLLAFVWVFATELLGVGLGYLIVYRRLNTSSFSRSLSRDLAFSMLKQGLPLVVALIAFAVYSRFDQLIVGYLIGDTAAGIYGMAVSINEFYFLLPFALISSAYPKMLQFGDVTDERSSILMQMVLSLLLLLALAMIFASYYAGGYVTHLVLGSAYDGVAPILTVYAVANIFGYFVIFSSRYLSARGEIGLVLRRSLVGAGVNVVLNLLLVPKVGLLGAAWAMVVTQALLAVALLPSNVGRQLLMLFVRAVAIWHLPRLYRRYRSLALTA
jgi:PST family polysaccharide transporter